MSINYLYCGKDESVNHKNCSAQHYFFKESPTGGLKHVSGKVRMDLISVDAMQGLAEVLTYGADVKGYGARNWEKGLEWSDTYGAVMRHLTGWFNGIDIDPESGLRHIDQAACNIMFLQQFTRRGTGTDNRPINKKGGPNVMDHLVSPAHHP